MIFIEKYRADSGTTAAPAGTPPGARPPLRRASGTAGRETGRQARASQGGRQGPHQRQRYGGRNHPDIHQKGVCGSRRPHHQDRPGQGRAHQRQRIQGGGKGHRAAPLYQRNRGREGYGDHLGAQAELLAADRRARRAAGECP